MSDSINTAKITSVPVEPSPAAWQTPLAAALASGSLPLSAYRGAQTTVVFSHVADELGALLTGCGVYDLGWRNFFRCAGRDRVRWLNGMVTNSVKGVEENAGCYSFVLNAQGRIQGDLDIYRRTGAEQEALWLQMDRGQVDTLTTFLRRYIIMDQVTLEPCDGWTAIGLAGPGAAEKLASLSLPGPGQIPIRLCETTWRGKAVVVVADYSPRVPRFQIWIDSASVLELWSALIEAGAVACGADAVEQLRLLEGTPAFGIDIGDRDLPQETNQMRALSFTKGCYLGQEIVERIRSRGNVHRTFSGFLLEGEPPRPRTPVLANGKPVGEITSASRVKIPGTGERTVALGYLRREVLEAKESLTAEGNSVTACALPFDFAGPAVQP